MKINKRVLVVAGALVSGAVSSGLVATGCGGDDATNAIGADAGSDASIDAGEDGPNGDVTVASDAGRDGTGQVMSEASTDTLAEANGRVDAGPDSFVDAGVPVDEAGILAFPTQVATAICERFANCCSPLADGSAFDTNTCIGQFRGFGYGGALPVLVCWAAGTLSSTRRRRNPV